MREMLRPDLAQHDVAVGDGERPAAPVAGRAGIGAGALRPDPEPPPVERADRSAAGRHGMDFQHRRPHPHPRHQPLAGPLIGAGEMRHVGRGAAHVEADDMVEAGLGRRLGHADDPAGRAGQDRVLAAEGGGVGEAAVGLHEEEASPSRLLPAWQRPGHDPIDIAPQHRRQIGVDHRRIAAPDQLDQRLDLMARADLGEADLLGQPLQRRLVRGPAPAVHQHDRQRPDARVERRLQPGPRRLQVQRLLHRAVGPHPLVDLDHSVVKRLRQHDLAGEDVRPRLRPDPERIAQPGGDRQRHLFALALEQGVGGDGRAHLHRLDRAAARLGQDRRDPGQRRVLIAFRILRQQLADDRPAVRPCATISVKVPPRSIEKVQPAMLAA